MTKEQTGFWIDKKDNVATALGDIVPGKVALLGNSQMDEIKAIDKISKGHKLCLKKVYCGEDIIKYGVCIGKAIIDIEPGSWVHLHNIKSVYDERSSNLDVVTGVAKDIDYQ